MPYSTWQLDTIVTQLETALAAGATAAEFQFEGRLFRAQSADEIRNRISYFLSLYNNAVDAPPNPPLKVRTFYMFGGKGIGF
jgi:hypothetical protein